MFTANASQVASSAPDGSDRRYLGNLGHVGALNYGFALPGGCDQLTCNLMQPPLRRYRALELGRLITVYRGATEMWRGKLNEPSPSSTGWALQAYGSGRFGDDYRAYYTDYSTPGDPVVKAIGRGLQWTAPAAWPTGLYLQQAPDSASIPVTDYMNNITGPAGYTWYVGRGGQLSVFTPPTVVNRLLVCTVPLARTLAGYLTWVWLRYTSKAQSTSASGTGSPGSGAAQFALTSVDNPVQAGKHGNRETYGDLSNAGQLSEASAETTGAALLAKYEAANFSGSITVLPGQLLNAGGAPVDLGCEQAGTVVSVILASGGYGGDVVPAPPLTFLTGAYSFNDENETATMTPFLAAASDFSTLLSNFTTLHAPRAPQSSQAIPYHP